MNQVVTSLLKKNLEDIQKSNPRFSLRSYAKMLDLSPSFLSRVLNGQKELSYLRADGILNKLGLSPTEKLKYITKLRSEYGLTTPRLDSATMDLNISKDLESKNPQVNENEFRVIADWYHAAIFALYEKASISEFTDIAERLEITVSEVSEAFGRMSQIGLYAKLKSGYKRKSEFFRVERTPSRAIRQFQKQLLYKAFNSFEGRAFNTRDSSSVMLTFDLNDFEEIMKEITKFRRHIITKFESNKETAKLYSLAVQFFPLEK